MSYSIHGRTNVGAYDQPFSGVGIEYYPLGVSPGISGVTLHETGYLPDNSQWNFPSVFSPFWRLHYSGDEGHCLLFGDDIIELNPDILILIPDHQLFHCLGQKSVPTWWQSFSFTGHLGAEMVVPVQLPVRDVELCLLDDLKTLISVNTSWEANDPIYRTTLALLQIVLARPELTWRPAIPAKLQLVQAYVKSHVREKMSNLLLAREAAMSIAGFERAFKRHFGTTPTQYVTDIRVMEASCRLIQTSMSIELVAEDTGFPNRNYFSRVFKSVTGESPAKFRHNHRI